MSSDNRRLPDVVGSSTPHNLNLEQIELGIHFRTISQISFDEVDYNLSQPGTPTKLTEL